MDEHWYKDGHITEPKVQVGNRDWNAYNKQYVEHLAFSITELISKARS